MRYFQSLHNGKVKIAHGRLGGDTSESETRKRRHDRAHRQLRLKQHLERITREAVEDCRIYFSFSGKTPSNGITSPVPKAKSGNPEERPQRRRSNNRSDNQPRRASSLTVTVVERRPRFKAYIREDGKICAAPLH
jgi:hypothetical protein